MTSKTRIERLEKTIKPERDQNLIIRVGDENMPPEEWDAKKAAGEVISVIVTPDPDFAYLFRGKK